MNLKNLGIVCLAIFCGLTFELNAQAAEVVKSVDDTEFTNGTDFEDGIEDFAMTVESMKHTMSLSEALDTIPAELVNPTELYSLELMSDPAYLARIKDVDLLARLIQREGGADCIAFADKVCIALTVLHRVDSPLFPNSVEEVIRSPRQYAKPAKDAWFKNRLAAEYAMRLWESGLSYSYLPEGYLYFTGDKSQRFNNFKNKQGERYELPKELIRVPGMETLFRAYQ